METWRKVFREAVAPLLSRRALEAVQAALAGDDAALIQGDTTLPPNRPGLGDWPPEGADALGVALWHGEGLETVAEVNEAWGRLCTAIDARLDEPAGCRWFLNWHDEVPREELRRELLPEVERALALTPADAAQAEAPHKTNPDALPR